MRVIVLECSEIVNILSMHIFNKWFWSKMHFLLDNLVHKIVKSMENHSFWLGSHEIVGFPGIKALSHLCISILCTWNFESFMTTWNS